MKDIGIEYRSQIAMSADMASASHSKYISFLELPQDPYTQAYWFNHDTLKFFNESIFWLSIQLCFLEISNWSILLITEHQTMKNFSPALDASITKGQPRRSQNEPQCLGQFCV